MESSPHLDIRDVIAAPAHALSAKQVLVVVLGLCGGLLIFDLFYYLGVIAEGQAPRAVFAIYGFLPFGVDSFQNTVAQAFFYVGAALGIFVLMLGLFGVSAIHVEALRGNKFLSARGAIKFAFQRWKQLAYSELAIILFVLFIIILYALFGLICRIPFIGEWIYSIFFVIPNFIVGLFVAFILFILSLSVILMPAVAAAERKPESFNVILETFSTVIRQPLRWVAYTAYTFVAAKLCSFVYAYFAYRAVQFVTLSSAIGGGDSVEQVVRSGLSHLPTRSDFVYQVLNIFPGVRWGITPPANGYFMTSDSTAGYVMAFMLFLIFASVIGYGLAIIAAGQARAYAVIRYVKDGYKISDEKPLFGDEVATEEKLEGERNGD